MTKSQACFMAVCLSLPLVAATCLGAKGPDGRPVLTSVGETVGAAGAALPPPWGWVLAGAGTLLSLIGGHFAGKAKQATATAPASSSPVVKALGERKWLFPLIGALIASLSASHVLPLTTAELAPILSMLGVAAGGEFLKDAITGSKKSA